MVGAETRSRIDTSSSVATDRTTASMATVDVGLVVGKISDLMKERGLRVQDLFKNPQFNPKYLAMRQQHLDASELQVLLAKVGLELSRGECKMMIRTLESDNDGSIDPKELDEAVRQYRRGRRDFQPAPVSPSSSKPPQERRKATGNSTTGTAFSSGRSTTSPAEVMDAISDLIDQRHMRIADIFRHPSFNPLYNQTGVDELNADEIAGVFSKAGLQLSPAEVRMMVDCLDEDGSGTLGISELEQVMRAHRRGNIDWDELLAQASARPKEVKKVNMKRLHDMSDAHRLRLEALRDKRERMEYDEQKRIEDAKEANRVGTRALLTDADFDPVGCQLRLHQVHRTKEVRREVRAAQYLEQEQRKLEMTRMRPMSRASSTPDLRRSEEASGSPRRQVGDRLHALHNARQDQRSKVLQQAEAQLLDQLDVISKNATARGQSPRHQKLYQEAETRRERREKFMHHQQQAADQEAQKQSVGAGRKKLTMEEIQNGRIHELHGEAALYQARREKLMKQQNEREAKAIDEAAKAAREEASKKLAGVRSKFRESQSPRASSPMSSPRSPRKQVGFGCAESRACLRSEGGAAEEPHGSRWEITAADHALHTVNTLVAMRCNTGMAPIEAREALSGLVEPLEIAMQEYRVAQIESETSGEGFMYLKKTESRRLFAEGNLLEDIAGWKQCCEPDPLRQIIEDHHELLKVAQRAQAALLNLVGPEQSFDPEQIKRRWPSGAKWNHPQATKKAQFAYNPGPKSAERAESKALVRYGPSQRYNRFRHLTDLARCSLVFADAQMLRAGLEQIVERFEVVDVRNYYHPSFTSLLGQKYVEVLVVVQCPEPFICEIRLEEMGFFVARERAQPHIDTIAQNLAELYTGAGAKANGIAYLAEWILHRPKECHATTVFRKHLSRRFGSTVAAWRRALGNGPLAPFLKFREACQDIGQRPRSVEFWQSLDATRAGCISLFELDPEPVVLLVKFYWRILGLVPQEHLSDPEQLFAKLTSKSVVKLNRAGQLEAHEFRRVTKPLGFGTVESDKIFTFLDSRGGEAMVPPATITPNDFAWLNRLPRLIDIQSAMLQDETYHGEMESLRAMNYAGRLHARGRIPAMATRDSAVSQKSIAQQQHVSSPTVFARRSVSAGSVCFGSQRQSVHSGMNSNRNSPRPSLRMSKNPSFRESFLQSIRLQLPLPEQALQDQQLLLQQQQQLDAVAAAVSASGLVSPGPGFAGDEALTGAVGGSVEVMPGAAKESEAETASPPSQEAPSAASETPSEVDCSASTSSPSSRAGAKAAPKPKSRPGPQHFYKIGDQVTVGEAFASDSARRVMLRKGQQGRVASLETGGALMVKFDTVPISQMVFASNVRKLKAADAGIRSTTSSSTTASSKTSRSNEISAVVESPPVAVPRIEIQEPPLKKLPPEATAGGAEKGDRQQEQLMRDFLDSDDEEGDEEEPDELDVEAQDPVDDEQETY